MKNNYLLTLALTLLSALSFSQASAQITFDNVPPLSGGGNTLGGISFNLTTSQSITIQNLRASFSTTTGTANIWYNPQKINGAPNISTANGWVNLGSATFAGISTASTSPTPQTIPIPLSLVMQPQDTFGFFIQWTGNVFSTTNTNTPTFTNGTVTIIADAKSAFTGPGTTPTFNPRQLNGGVIYTLNTPCSGMPTAGVATTPSTTICPNTSFKLSLTGSTMGSGLTYQWQSSPNGTAWTDITGATASTLTTTQLTTTHYRARVTCGTQTATSTPVIVSTNATPVSGTFTINKILPASATNFQSFAAAIASIECGGVNGPTVFNVVANTGPYNEEVIIPAIPGTSATNTVTFNGNNNVVTFANTASNRSVFRLDGSDFVNLNGFNIQPSDLVYGWGVHLLNGADNNTITNNTITIASTSTTEANSAGVVFSNSTTSVTVAGNTGSNNVISANTITGGYKGIHLNHEITTASNNQLINNIITDFYADGIKVNAAKGTLVEGNNISRPTRGAVTTFAGIEVSGNSQMTLISKNRIHNTHGGATSKTGTVYGLFFTAADAPVGSENIARNNLIYNINNTGTIYGIYNTSSDGAHYFHNTISLDNALNTGINRGFFQTTLASNIRFINNIVSINAGATGAKHTLYFGTITSTITSNGNVLHLAGGASTSGIGFYTSNRLTLADWQTGSSQDANSVSADPVFANAATGDFTPTNVAVNNSGQPGTGVTTDINGLARNPNAPDPGAYEFLNLTNDIGITAITSPNSLCGLSASEVITVIVTNFGTLPQSNIPVSYTINGGTPVTAIIPGPLAPGATLTYNFATPANLSAQGGYTIVAGTNLTGDLNASNNSTTKVVTNARFTTLPQLNFETPATGINAMRLVTNTRSNIFEDPAASLGTGSTKGLVLDAMTSTSWAIPVGINDPWTTNPEHFAAAYICFDPQGATNPTTPLWLSFDLKQLFKGANANTNFRVTVNGTPVGGNQGTSPANTYRPPFSGTPIDWEKVYIDLTPYKNLPSIEIGFESSVSESFANGAGTANLIDNIQIVRVNPTGTKENILAASLNVYPNPSNGTFSVSLPKGKAFEMEVTDLTGKVVMKQTVKSNATQLNLKETAKGVYMLKIVSEGKTAVQKLIIQ